MSTTTKRAHYIPECYSANFCTDGSNPPTCFLYMKSKPTTLPVPVQPQDWGNKRYYYAFEKKDGARDTQTLEKMFGICEWPARKDSLVQ